VSADSELCDIGIEGSCPYACYKPLPGVFLFQPSPLYAQGTEILAPSFVGLQYTVSSIVVEFLE
jgi:hypothetical protein